MKTIQLLLSVILATRLHAAEDTTIQPGRGVGSVSLLTPMSSLEKRFGPALWADVAMGRQWAAWSADPTKAKFAVFCIRPDDHTFVVQSILVLSPDYKTTNGVSVGNALAEILKEFPDSEKGTTYDSGIRKARVTLYDCPQRGIAFEFPANPKPTDKCIGIIIRPPAVPLALF